MIRALSLAVLLVATCPTSIAADIAFKIFTEKGFVSFVAAEDWTVLSMESKLPVAQAVFQLPNPADEGSPHSTNLIVKFYQLGTARSGEATEAPKQYGSTPLRRETFEEWTIYRQSAPQGNASYTILDASRKLPEVAVSVRLAWPHLSRNANTYDERMEEVFRAFLQSVAGHIGPHTPQEGEIIRRPTR